MMRQLQTTRDQAEQLTRIGGEEFGMLLLQTLLEQAAQLVEDLRQVIVDTTITL